ncbi:MAG: hypothetical protein WCC06_02710 [Candidatus Aminicenantales bacterium]
MKKLIFILTAIIATASFLGADVHIKSKTHTDAFEMMGQVQPAKDELTEQWIGNNIFATFSSKQNMVIDLNKNMMYVIYPQDKSYVEAQLPLDLSKLLPPEAAQMLSMFQVTAKVTPTDETKKVGDWNSTGYDMEMNFTGMMSMTMNLKIWASTEVHFDWKTYMEEMYPAVLKVSSISMPLTDDIVNEFKKIKGFQVASEMTMNIMGANMRVTTEVIEIAEKPAPAETYSVPAGFTKKDTLSLQRDF